MEAEPLIYRPSSSRRALAKKKKMSRKEISERARINAENSPIVRQLRELYEQGMAEQARRKREGRAG